MPRVEERIASLEGRMGKVDDLHTLITALREDMNRGFSEARLDLRHEVAQVREDTTRQFGQLREEMRGELTGVRENTTRQVVQLREDMSRELAQAREDTTRQFVHIREDMAEMRVDIRTRFEQVDRRFTWVLGVQMALMLAVIGSLLGAYLR